MKTLGVRIFHIYINYPHFHTTVINYSLWDLGKMEHLLDSGTNMQSTENSGIPLATLLNLQGVK